MTKKDIVKIISERFDIPHLRAKQLVQYTFDAIIDTLVNEQRLEVRNFGVFQIKKRESRKARNPKTGEQVIIPTRNVVTFKAGKEMEARIKAKNNQTLDESRHIA